MQLVSHEAKKNRMHSRLLAYATTTANYLHECMAALQYNKAVTKPPLQYRVLNYRPSKF